MHAYIIDYWLLLTIIDYCCSTIINLHYLSLIIDYQLFIPDWQLAVEATSWAEAKRGKKDWRKLTKPLRSSPHLRTTHTWPRRWWPKVNNDIEKGLNSSYMWLVKSGWWIGYFWRSGLQNPQQFSICPSVNLCVRSFVCPRYSSWKICGKWAFWLCPCP